jgi:6-phosphogluconolactonase
MIEAEWWDYEDGGEWAEAVAGDIGFIVESAVEARGEALIALPGGAAAAPVFALLAAAKLPWKRVTIVPTDDLLVPLSDERSNVRSIAQALLATGARVFPITGDIADAKLAGNSANAKLGELKFPLDLAWLAVGAAGNAAGMVDSPDIDEALNAPKGRHAVGLTPADGGVARITLTRSAILSARTVLLTVAGEETKALVEGAIADGQSSKLPIGRVLAEADQPIDIHWVA